jgi:glycosyltransferase involved in cell wall biosynthesis
VTVHDLRVFEAEFASPMDQQIISSNVSSAAALVCSWAHPYEHLVQLFPEAASKIFLIPLPVLNQGSPTNRPAPTSEVRLLYPAHVTPHKNHEVILRGMVERPNLTLTCTGSEVPSHAVYLRRLAQELGVASRVTWRGFISAAELEAEYAKAHILTMPTRWEAASGPLFEAIVRELPFVASNISPLRAQLRSLNLDAPSFDWDDASQFVAAVDSVVDDYEGFRKSLVEPAKLVRGRTWRDTADEYSEVFSWAAGTGSAPDHLQPPRHHKAEQS